MQPFILCSIYKRFIDKQEQVFIEHTYLKNMGEKNEEMGPVYVGKASHTCNLHKPKKEITFNYPRS
jgi:hypothetical protein